MRGRIEKVQSDGWNRSECFLDVAALMADHNQRERLFADLKGKSTSTDWDDVREHLNELILLVGPV